MDRNSYAPPAATVSDPIAASLLARPNIVRRGVLLLWISFAFSVLDTGWDFYTKRQEAPAFTIAIAVLTIVIYGFVAMVVYKIAQRRNWTVLRD